jgi:hypothetical protein
METIKLPITNTGRKYGYITWKKTDDSVAYDFFSYHPNKRNIYLRINDRQIIGKIDWKRRRVWITYNLTRKIPAKNEFYLLSYIDERTIEIKFQ